MPLPGSRKPKNAYTIDRAKLENIVEELSAIFKDYRIFMIHPWLLPDRKMEVYKSTTDGVVLKEPLRYASLVASAYVMTEDGVRIDDAYSVLVARPDDLPSLDELKKGVKAFADNLIKLKNAPAITEYYAGPVLLEDGACSSVFISNFLKRGALFAYRKPDTDRVQPVKTLMLVWG